MQATAPTRAETRDLFNELSLLSSYPNHAATILYRNGAGDERVRTITAIHAYVKNGVPTISAFDDLRQMRITLIVARIEPICLWEDVSPAAAKRGIANTDRTC